MSDLSARLPVRRCVRRPVRTRARRSRTRGRTGGFTLGGFTLVETALVLLVLGLLTRAFVVPLGERLERQRQTETAQRLESVRRALIGHLVTRGVLPCPLRTDEWRASGARDTADGTEADCLVASGAVPATLLGVAGAVDASGALLDAWGAPLHYAVSLASSGTAGDPARADWTSPGEAAAVGLAELDADLVLCRVAASGACPREALRADAIAFVVLSRGRDGSARDAQRENLDGDRVYALAPRSGVDGHRFDDTLVWASRNELAYWLLRAEWLP